MQRYIEASFALDSLPGVIYVGFTDGDDWNGFSRPLFEFDVAQQVLRDSVANGIRWEYIDDQDAFMVSYDLEPDDEPYEFQGFIISVDGADKRVYGIGAGSWIWEQMDN